MEVSTWHSKDRYGIRIPPKSRDKYFDRSWSSIEVQMDGEIHCFELTKSFWADCPEFRDKGKPIIKTWLEKHNKITWKKGFPPHFNLIPITGKLFRLETL